MGEVISDDVVEWARDLAAMRRLFAGEEAKGPLVCQPVAILPFAPRQLLHGPLALSEDGIQLPTNDA